MPSLKEPEKGEVATTDKSLDFISTYVGGLLAPQDKVLLNNASGDYGVYREMLRDDQIASAFQQRRSAVTSTEWEVMPGAEDSASKEAAEDLAEQIRGLRWDEITDRMLYGIYYGHAIGECMWESAGPRYRLANVLVRRASRFRYHQDGGLYLLTANNPQGERMPEQKFWTFTAGGETNDDPYGIGLAHYLYWPALFKRNDIKFWMIFLERYAQPTPLAKAPRAMTETPAERTKLLQMLAAIQTDSGVVVPDSVAIDFIQIARSGTADYETLHARMNAAITKIILSQTLTSEDTGGQYKADVQYTVRQEVIKADADALSASFNAGPATWITRWNYGDAATPPKLWRKTEQPEDMNKRAERDERLRKLGFKPSQDYMTGTYGEGWEPAQDAGQGAAAGLGAAASFADVPGYSAAHRQDQAAIALAAQQAAQDYSEIMGQAIADLENLLESSKTIEEFQEKLASLAGQPPQATVVDRITRNTFTARLLGLLRGQRTGAAA
jgi:phage gp29-like protein